MEQVSGQVTRKIGPLDFTYSVKNSTVDCKYLLFLQDFSFKIKTKTLQKNANIADCLKESSGNS